MFRRAAVSLVLLASGVAVCGQVTSNPLPARIVSRGLTVEVRDVMRMPDTRAGALSEREFPEPAWARVGYVRDLPDGRRFVSDLRGYLYAVRDGRCQVYLDVAAEVRALYFNRLEGGFIAVAFHPEFSRTGLFYTLHAEGAPSGGRAPDFIPIGFSLKDVTYQVVLTEWHASVPSAAVFSGSRRELLRTAEVVRNLTHPLGDIEFNPVSKPGDADYGLLYVSGSDHGFSNGGGPNASSPAQTQRLDSIVTALLRIDPHSPSVSRGTPGVGDYTVPPANLFASDGNPLTLGEIYAFGFRNAHRFSWDVDGTMFVSDIGMNQIEELDIVHNGANYGWMRREGVFAAGRATGGDLREVLPLSDDLLSGRQNDGLTYPVAMFDHDEGRAISGGFAYHGNVEALRGRFVFGDLVSGRIFAADLTELKRADDGIPRTVAAIEEVQLVVRSPDGTLEPVSLLDVVERTLGRRPTRVDLNLALTRDGELLLGTRQDGMVRTLLPARP